MNIKEHFIEAKNGNLIDCEDGLFISDNFIAVIDGATAKNKIKIEGKSSGNYAKEIILETLSEISVDSTAFETINYINDIIDDKAKLLPKDYNMAASIIIYSRNKNEIWNFGDCQCLINGREYFHQKEIDILTSNLRSEYMKKLLDIGYIKADLLENDLGRKAILPILKEQYKLMNTNSNKYGYPCLNGKIINNDDIIIYKINKGDEIVLSSDGYPHLKSSLKESEEYLKQILEKDPLLIDKYKSTKGLKKGNVSFDDRTYIRFIV